MTATGPELRDCDETIWEAFVEESSVSTLFSSVSFLKTTGRKLRYLLCVDGGEVIGGVALPIGPRGIEEVIYGGLLYSDLPTAKDYKRIEKRFAMGERIARDLFDTYPEVALSNYWNVTDMRPFQWHNYHEPEKGAYRVDVRHTSLLDIRPEALAAGCKEVRLNSLKTAAKSGLQTQVSTDVTKLHRLHELTFSRQGLVRRADEGEFVCSVARGLMDAGRGRLYITSKDAIPASAAFFGFDRRRAYYIFGASDPEFRKMESGTRNLFDAFADLNRDLGIEQVDLLGVNSPQRGSFKLSLGGSLVPYFLVTKVPPR